MAPGHELQTSRTVAGTGKAGGRNALGVSSRGAQGNPGEPGGSGRRVTWREGASVSKSIS